MALYYCCACVNSSAREDLEEGRFAVSYRSMRCGSYALLAMERSLMLGCFTFRFDLGVVQESAKRVTLIWSPQPLVEEDIWRRFSLNTAVQDSAYCPNRIWIRFLCHGARLGSFPA